MRFVSLLLLAHVHRTYGSFLPYSHTLLGRPSTAPISLKVSIRGGSDDVDYHPDASPHADSKESSNDAEESWLPESESSGVSSSRASEQATEDGEVSGEIGDHSSGSSHTSNVVEVDREANAATPIETNDGLTMRTPTSPEIVTDYEVPVAQSEPSIVQTPQVQKSTTANYSIPESPVRAKLANLQGRVGPAVLLLLGLFAIVRVGQERGLQCLAIVLSPGLFHEAIGVTGMDVGAIEWSWFLSYALLTALPAALSNHVEDLRLTGFIGVVLTIVGTIYRLNASQATNENLKEAIGRMATSHIALVMTLLPCTCWIAILSQYSRQWLLYAALLVILNDTIAYAFGMTIGKRPLLPEISPKKTIEGFVGGGVSTMLLSPVAWKLLFSEKFGRHGLVIALFCNLLAPFGGFLASVTKRAYGKKDFGDLIQGHGGLIDRLDCQLFTAPFLFLYLQLAMDKTPSPV